MKTKPAINDLAECYLNCELKAWYKFNWTSKGSKNDYHVLLDEQKNKIKAAFRESLESVYQNHITLSGDISHAVLSKAYEYIFGGYLSKNECKIQVDILKKVNTKSNLGDHSYIPVALIGNEITSKQNKLILSLTGWWLYYFQGIQAELGEIIYGNQIKVQKVHLIRFHSEIKPLLQRIERLSIRSERPLRIPKSHCSVCEFKVFCRSLALEQDHLSLLSGINEREIIKYNNKGIFTVNQLSYTFRPRRRKKKYTNVTPRHNHALKALSLRENKTYVYKAPALPNTNTKIYFDFEGLPELPFCYLIGMIISHNGLISDNSFWADSKDEENEIFLRFISTIEQYDNVSLYHYGNYEIKHLKRISKKVGLSDKKVNAIIASCCNVLPYVYSYVYFPTYSNSLKEIGNYIGVHWSEKKASGIQSIVWRKQWENSNSGLYKDRLIKYNIEDCYALMSLVRYIDLLSIKHNTEKSGHKHLNAIFVNDLKREYPFKFWDQEFALKEFDLINRSSYFDYQRERVHIRDHKLPKKKKANKPIRAKNPHRTNKTVIIHARKCLECKNKHIDKKQQISRKIIDLKFTNGGLKRWITRYKAFYYLCHECKARFLPLRYKKIQSKYGHNLICWSLYQYIENNLSFISIEKDFYELFKLNIPKTMIHEFKRYFLKYYTYTYSVLEKKILNSEVLYIDETPLKMKFETGYAWVLTNSSDVILFYRPSREGEFLKAYLKGFGGIVVSDFYSAYDSLECKQQKCLIHLIRDLNDDLLKNPFNDEFKQMTKHFTVLLQSIIATVDRYKLRKRYLNKHKRDVELFYKKVLNEEYNTEISQKYQKRFKRNKDKLFLFLDHDNVSWNNTNAEHAIKMMATHRNRNIQFFHASRMDDYLRIMSIYLTCHFKNISFLNFLLSLEKDVDRYCEKYIYKSG